MLSRVADSIFWMGRYTERVENYARFIDVNFNLSIDLPPGVKEQWAPLVATTGDDELYRSIHGANHSRECVMHFLAFDNRNLNAIISSVGKARENARIVRENIPKETWEVLNELYFFMKDAVERKIWKSEDPRECFREIRNQVQLLNGIADANIPKTQEWYFSRLGQFLERADKTSRILDVKYHYLLPSVAEVGSPLDFLQWTALLKSVSGYNSFRREYGKITPRDVVEYMVFNRYFPRSILYCLMAAEDCLHEISESQRGYSNPPEKKMGNLRSELEFADIDDLFAHGLHEYMDKLQSRINTISAAVHQQYFKIQPNFPQQAQNQA